MMVEIPKAEVLSEIHEPAFVRRFELADLSRHGPWLLKRLSAVFEGETEQYIGGWLSGLLYSNEHLFLYQDHSVALAQVVHGASLRPKPILQERFVWLEDKNDKSQVEHAADFYLHFQVWAQRQGIERMILCENTDVPKAKIEDRVGRLFDTKISHARV